MADERGVPGPHLDGLRRHAEMRRAQLRQGRRDALPHGQRAGIDRNLSGRRDTDPRGLERPAPRRLDAIGQADATAQAARGAGARIEFRIADLGQRARLQGRKIAAVDRERHPGPGLQRLDIGDLVRRNQVAPAAFRAVDAHALRDPVQHAFHHECRLRIARARARWPRAPCWYGPRSPAADRPAPGKDRTGTMPSYTARLFPAAYRRRGHAPSRRARPGSGRARRRRTPHSNTDRAPGSR